MPASPPLRRRSAADAATATPPPPFFAIAAALFATPSDFQAARARFRCLHDFSFSPRVFLPLSFSPAVDCHFHATPFLSSAILLKLAARLLFH
jgi:hypothetical protein